MGERHWGDGAYRQIWSHGFDGSNRTDGRSIDGRWAHGLYGIDWDDWRYRINRSYGCDGPHRIDGIDGGDGSHGPYWQQRSDRQHWIVGRHRQHRLYRGNWRRRPLGCHGVDGLNWAHGADRLCSKRPQRRDWAYWFHWCYGAYWTAGRSCEHWLNGASGRYGITRVNWSNWSKWADGRCVDGHGANWADWAYRQYWAYRCCWTNRASRSHWWPGPYWIKWCNRAYWKQRADWQHRIFGRHG